MAVSVQHYHYPTDDAVLTDQGWSEVEHYCRWHADLYGAGSMPAPECQAPCSFCGDPDHEQPPEGET
jgi:hypothetical protein